MSARQRKRKQIRAMQMKKFKALLPHALHLKLNFEVKDFGYCFVVFGVRYDENGEQWRNAIHVRPGRWSRKHSPFDMVWHVAKQLEQLGYATCKDGSFVTRITEADVRAALYNLS